MYVVMVKSRLASATPALMCAAVAVTLPVFDVLGELSIWMNTACFALFWSGWLLLLCMPAHGIWRFVVRLLALTVFFLAFNLNSQLVFYCAFAACVVVLPRLGEGGRSVLASLCRALIRYPDFAALPFAFWIWKRLFTPNSGYYEGYNVPSLSPDLLGRVGDSLVQGFLGGEVVGLFESPSWLVLVLAMVGLVALWADRKALPWPEPASATDGAHLFCGGMFLLLAGAFPYAVVDQSFQSFGWLTRNSILLGLPLGMMIVGGVSFLGARLAPARPGLVWVILALVVLLGIGSANRTTLRWQAFGAKQASIAAKLQPTILQTGPALVQIRDYCMLPQTISYYAPIVWTYMLCRGEEAPKTFVLETAQIAPDQVGLDSEGRQHRQITLLAFDEPAMRSAIEQTTMPYAMREIPLHGPQMVAVVEVGELGTDGVGIGWDYLRKRLLDGAAIPDFLQRLTIVQTHELDAIPAGAPYAPSGG